MGKMLNLIEPELKKLGYFQLHDELEKMALIQKYFAKTYTFENLDVLLNDNLNIDENFLIEKLLIKKRGGLCYELNGTLYLVLKGLGFDVTLGAATVWSKDGWIIDRTHTVILFYKGNDMYLLDSGSGSNLSLRPLQLDGKSVRSPVGVFRLRTKDTERGSIITEKLTKDGWILHCAFYPEPVGFDDLNRIKNMIHDHPQSPFNKTLLVAKTVIDGTVSITDQRLIRKWMNEKGIEEKEERIEFHNSKDILNQLKIYSTEATYEAAKRYLKNQQDPQSNSNDVSLL